MTTTRSDSMIWFVREADQGLTWLAFTDNVPLGMFNMLIFTRMPRPGVSTARSQWGYVANVYVLGSQRDRGWGAKLMETCIAYAAEHNYARLVLSPSERSIPLYERAGFSPASSLMTRSFE